VDKIVVVVSNNGNILLLKTYWWINIMKSTGFLIKKAISLRKRRVLRKDMCIQFSTAPFLSTHKISLNLFLFLYSITQIYKISSFHSAKKEAIYYASFIS